MDLIGGIVPAELFKGDENDVLRVAGWGLAMASDKVENLLGIARDTKTKKSLDKLGVLTGVLYLAPALESGIEMCHARTRGCTSMCLYRSGHGFSRNIQIHRLRKTYQFIYRREEFMQTLVDEIGKLSDQASKKGLVPAVRLNGTSDIDWENIPIGEHENIFSIYPNMQFYDYTKRIGRVRAVAKIPNYHLTFSLAETKANRANAIKAASLGANVAVVFERMPETYALNGTALPVIDGDETDVRFWDKSDGPVIVGLSPKGKAGADTSGFVIRAS